jgi:large subunit ribosomal protein L35
MPKIKSHSGAKKRFKRTKNGKWLYKQAGQRHLLAGDKSKSGRRRRRPEQVAEYDRRTLNTFLPYN